MSNNETKSSCREGKFRELRKGIVGNGRKDMQGMEERKCREWRKGYAGGDFEDKSEQLSH